MYFDEVKLFDLEENIIGLDNYLAHTSKDNCEKLRSHINLVYKYFIKICCDKNLDNVFYNFEHKILKDLSQTAIAKWKELLCNAIYMHDIGKINASFQCEVMKNEKFKDYKQLDSNHSMLSSCLYFNHYFGEVCKFEGEEKKLLLVFLCLNTYIISKHHGALDDDTLSDTKLREGFMEWVSTDRLELYDCYRKSIDSNIEIKKLEGYYKYVRRALSEKEEKEKWESIDFYIYIKLVFSLLVASDYYATSHFKNNIEITDIGIINDINRFYIPYKKSKKYSGIKKYKEFLSGEGEDPFVKIKINKLRTEMFLEAESNLCKNIVSNIYYLEAPTGSGKTMTSVNLAFKMLEQDKRLNKIFYIFPFNTLVEQTKKSLDEFFEGHEDIKRDIAVINSITPIRIEEKVKEDSTFKVIGKNKDITIDYEKSLLNRQFLHYPIVLTTHINLFNYFFGTSREEIFPLAHIANSVVILDEIQSYRNDIWKEIILFLRKYAELLNIKIIIMSATLPKLSKLADTQEGFVDLIKNRNEYFENELFKNRVNPDFTLIDIKDDILDKLFEKVIEERKKFNGNILIEFIKKAAAFDFYKRVSDFMNDNNISGTVLMITGDDNKAERKKIINRVKKEKNIILVATQVIEAGVDIDMDLGFKDISILDAEEQFFGRINRSYLNPACKVYFFNLDEANVIYKKDCRKEKELTLLNENMRQILINKNFENFYAQVFQRIDVNVNRYNDGNIEDFRKNSIGYLKCEELRKRMKLIEEDKMEQSVFFNRTIRLENNENLSGKEVWQQYYDTLTNKELDYAERKYKLSVINEKMDYFIYKIRNYRGTYNDIIGDIIYIEDGDKYFTGGKLDRAKVLQADKFELIDI